MKYIAFDCCASRAAAQLTRYMASLNGQRVLQILPLPDVAAPVEPMASLLDECRWCKRVA